MEKKWPKWVVPGRKTKGPKEYSIENRPNTKKRGKARGESPEERGVLQKQVGKLQKKTNGKKESLGK